MARLVAGAVVCFLQLLGGWRLLVCCRHKQVVALKADAKGCVISHAKFLQDITAGVAEGHELSKDGLLLLTPVHFYLEVQSADGVATHALSLRLTQLGQALRGCQHDTCQHPRQHATVHTTVLPFLMGRLEGAASYPEPEAA